MLVLKVRVEQFPQMHTLLSKISSHFLRKASDHLMSFPEPVKAQHLPVLVKPNGSSKSVSKP